MARSNLLTVILLGLCSSLVLAEVVGVSGSNAQYSTPVAATVGDKQVNLVLTGTALRKKYFFNVYAIGSYVQEGAGVRTAEQLAAANCARRLHLVLERDVSGKDMAEAFRTAIRQNYPAPQFNDEITSLVASMQARDVRKGEHVWLTHIPGVGLHVNHVGKTDLVIRNPQFSQAVWNIYLGKNNLGEAIKSGLTSRL